MSSQIHPELSVARLWASTGSVKALLQVFPDRYVLAQAFRNGPEELVQALVPTIGKVFALPRPDEAATAADRAWELRLHVRVCCDLLKETGPEAFKVIEARCSDALEGLVDATPLAWYRLCASCRNLGFAAWLERRAGARSAGDGDGDPPLPRMSAVSAELRPAALSSTRRVFDRRLGADSRARERGLLDENLKKILHEYECAPVSSAGADRSSLWPGARERVVELSPGRLLAFLGVIEGYFAGLGGRGVTFMPEKYSRTPARGLSGADLLSELCKLDRPTALTAGRRFVTWCGGNFARVFADSAKLLSLNDPEAPARAADLGDLVLKLVQDEFGLSLVEVYGRGGGGLAKYVFPDPEGVNEAYGGALADEEARRLSHELSCTFLKVFALVGGELPRSHEEELVLLERARDVAMHLHRVGLLEARSRLGFENLGRWTGGPTAPAAEPQFMASGVLAVYINHCGCDPAGALQYARQTMAGSRLRPGHRESLLIQFAAAGRRHGIPAAELVRLVLEFRPGLAATLDGYLAAHDAGRWKTCIPPDSAFARWVPTSLCDPRAAAREERETGRADAEPVLFTDEVLVESDPMRSERAAFMVARDGPEELIRRLLDLSLFLPPFARSAAGAAEGLAWRKSLVWGLLRRREPLPYELVARLAARCGIEEGPDFDAAGLVKALREYGWRVPRAPQPASGDRAPADCPAPVLLHRNAVADQEDKRYSRTCVEYLCEALFHEYSGVVGKFFEEADFLPAG